MNNKIEGIIIDAGHGGIDSGAVGNNLLEKELTLEASLYIYNRLNELGIPTKLTREADEYLPKEARIRRVLDLYNNNPNTILISNHINAGGAEGAEVIYSLKNNSTLADLVLENIKDKGQIARKTYQRRLPEDPNKDYYYILRETGNTEPILIEYGFIDNKNDSKKLKENLLSYAEGVVKAITEYIDYPYTEPIENAKQDYYIVEKGDTLYSISKKINIPIEEIKKNNSITDTYIIPGQKLYLKEQIEIPTSTYVVQKGDTFYSIARKYNISVEELKKINNITSNTLNINQILKVPTNNIIEEEIVPNVDYEVYIVSKGDSLYSIARKYGINLNDLIKINNLEDLTIKVNQKLLIPRQNIENNLYTVKKGDTLWSIAKKNNLEVSKLKEINNLDNNLLTIGQILIIK